MCNLYHMAPRDHVERCFRAIVPEHAAVPVGPYGTGLFLRPIDGRMQGVIGQWGMIRPQARARRPDSRAILTNNARAETVSTRPTVSSFTMLTVNCDGHPLLGRLHKPDPKLPACAQDKRSVVPLERERWTSWFAASPAEATAMLVPPPMECFDLAEARRTDQLLGRS